MTITTQHFFEPASSTLSYIVYDAPGGTAVVIDPVLGFDARSGRTSEAPLEPMVRFLDERRLRPAFALDTHAHADHMTALAWFKERYDAQTVIGSEIVRVQRMVAELYNLGPGFVADGGQFDRLLADGEVLDAGPFSIRALYSPGHTPACVAYHVEQALFVGDVLFMPDHGTARCDFPGGSASDLYDSVLRLYDLPGETLVYTCHDYQPGGRPLQFCSTIHDQRQGNAQLTRETTREQFVAFRQRRDASLDLPALMLAVLQVNIRAGGLPPAEDNGTAYLKLPLNRL